VSFAVNPPASGDLADAAQEVFVFPASFAQQRLWFLNQLAPDNPFYNVSAALRLKGNLDLVALERTVNEIVRRHEVLRTTFVSVEGQLCQAIAPHLHLPVAVVNLSTLSGKAQEAAVRQQATAAAQRSFNLSTGPLLRVVVLKLEASEHVLLLTLHHVVADGWSVGVLVRELGALYTAFRLGKPSPLPELPLQYADFAQWQRQWLQGEKLENLLSYWRQQLAGITPLNLWTDYPRPAIPRYTGAEQRLDLSQDLSQGLQALSQESGTTLFMTLLAAFQTLLYRYSGQEDICVGSPIANRNRSELEGLIGFFVNSLVLRTDLSGNPTFRELLARVRETTLAAYAHQDLPFEQLVQALHPERDLSHHPLFQIALAVQNTPIAALELPNLSLSLLELDSGTARLDLELQFWETPAGLKGQVIYSTELFDADTITRMLEHFQVLLTGIVRDPEQRLSELPLLGAAERQLLGQRHSAFLPLAASSIQQVFEAQAARTPDATAVVYADQPLTYAQLNQQANQLAQYLQQRGVGPETMVGLCVERSLEMVVGLMGILKAGGAFVPLDPSYPPERLAFMLADSQAPVLLTQQSLLPHLPQHSAQIICLDRDWPAIQTDSVIKNQKSKIKNPQSLAYLIYTSGSTGQPKGVLVPQRGLINLAQAQRQIFDLTPASRVLQFASLSFDAAIFEIVMALTTGAALYLIPNAARTGSQLVKWLQTYAITHATLPPAVLRTLPAADLPALQTLISAGEACSPEIVTRWGGNRCFFNAYGLTETTVWATVGQIRGPDSQVSLGGAIANTQVYILDSYLQSLPMGTPGELYIGGLGVARGYLNRADLTAERFLPNPFGSPGSRLYRTGDWGRYASEGHLEFLGRIDHQFKVRGYRIELGEIEAVLGQQPSLEAAAVVVREQAPGLQQLVAHVVFRAEPIPINALRQFLQKQLPAYMVPDVFLVQPSLPLTASGKVDRSALKGMAVGPQPRAFTPPRTPTEVRLAKLWAQLLNLEQVGIQDNFFELGGDSLLAAQLVDRVQTQLQLKLSLSDFFLAPTIEQLARLLEQDDQEHGAKRPRSPLVLLQPSGLEPPFFCVHPIFGVVLPYVELAAQLGDNQPFYGLQSLGLDGTYLPLTTIEEMATHYLEAVRSVQPQGPYYLGGWSFGGLVAFEMARQLQESGQDVGCLALMDTPAPAGASISEGFDFLLTTVAGSILPFLVDYGLLLLAPMQEHLQKLGIWPSFLPRATLTALIPEAETQLRLLDELTLDRILQIFYANSRAVLNYVPQPYPQPLTLFTTDETVARTGDPLLGWQKLARGGINRHPVPGNHLTLLRQPQVQILAKQLRSYLGHPLPQPTNVPLGDRMNPNIQSEPTLYKVVNNHEEQYSIWPADRDNALGWKDVGYQGSKAECLAYIQTLWTDLRPLSLRRQMESGVCYQPETPG